MEDMYRRGRAASAATAVMCAAAMGFAAMQATAAVEFSKAGYWEAEGSPRRVETLTTGWEFSLDDFSYSVESDPQGQGLLVTMKQKKSAKGTIKEVKALVKYHTYEPIQLKLKVAFFWTTVKISNFKSGGIDDSMFIFPAERYKDWKKVDKRKK